MSKLGKIFGILVVVLSIAVAVLSFMVSKHREQFRDRAAVLAEGVSKTGSTLSQGTGSAVGGSVTFTPAPAGGKESGTLGWNDYKTNASGYKDNIGKVVDLAKKVSDQRNKMSDALKSIGEELKLPADLDVSSESLNNLGSYDGALASMASHIDAVKKRDEALRVSLENLSGVLKSIGDSFGEEAFYTRKVKEGGAAPAKEEKKEGEEGEEAEEAVPAGKAYEGYQYEEALAALEGAARKLVERAKDYEACFRDMINAIPKYSWRTSANALPSDAYKNILKGLVDDAKAINAKIAGLEESLAKTKALLDEKTGELKTCEAENAKLQEELKAMTKERDLLKKRLDFIGGGSEQVAPEVKEHVVLENVKEVSKDITGNIIGVIKEWNLVTLNLGNDKVVPGLKLAVNQGGEYVATIKIIKCEERVSMGEVILGKVDDIKEGAVVFMSATGLQGADKAKED